MHAGGLGALFSGRNVRPLLIGSSLMLFQQITGQPSVLYYAARIFKDAGFASDTDATRVSVVLGSFKLVMTGGSCLSRRQSQGNELMPQGCRWFWVPSSLS